MNQHPSGEIDFPVLGDIKVSGMTRSELSGYIKGELMGRELVKDPTVIVDFLSTGISIIGEVNKPGRYDLNRDNINIIEALALAGDLTVDVTSGICAQLGARPVRASSLPDSRGIDRKIEQSRQLRILGFHYYRQLVARLHRYRRILRGLQNYG